MKYILIHGLKGHGKSTLANMIYTELSNLDYRVAQFILADPAREMLSKLFDLDSSQFESEEFKNTPHADLYNQTPRKVMQTFATDFAQNCFGKTFWCKKLEENVSSYIGDIDFVIIPDIRFLHELNYFSEKSLSTIFMNREGVEKDEANNHISEAGLLHMYEESNHDHIRLEFPEDSTLEGTQEFVREVLIDMILEGRNV